jgi:hypothetical protein
LRERLELGRHAGAGEFERLRVSQRIHQSIGIAV